LGIALIRAEKESLIKSFAVFFLSLSVLAFLLGYLEYFKLKHETQEKIFNEMRVCSYDLKCTNYEFDFVPLESAKLYHLTESSTQLFALFSIPKNSKYSIKLSLSKANYEEILKEKQREVFYHFIYLMIVIILISWFFSLYALHPLRKALTLTEEFSKDILHDLNTPLSSLRLNINMLTIDEKDTKKLERINKSIDSIASLGQNLKNHLAHHDYQVEIFDLHGLIEERMLVLQKLFGNIGFYLNNESFKLLTSKNAFIRVVDNLLNNACKYNIPNGVVKIEIDEKRKILLIKDSGYGIENPQKIFERFYQENKNSRGEGLGLHIVKKISDEMKIDIKVESVVDKGTIFTLDLSKIVYKKG
jgi:signal transduction histidine kinase